MPRPGGWPITLQRAHADPRVCHASRRDRANPHPCPHADHRADEAGRAEDAAKVAASLSGAREADVSLADRQTIPSDCETFMMTSWCRCCRIQDPPLRSEVVQRLPGKFKPFRIQRVQRRAIKVLPVRDDGLDGPRIADIPEGIGVEQHEIGQLPWSDRAERVGRSQHDGRIERRGL